MPLVSGSSGPTTVNWTLFCWANLISRGKSVGERSTFSASIAVPALPGATNTRSTRELWAIFQASACSRPPLPITSTFMMPPSPVAEMLSCQAELPWTNSL